MRRCVSALALTLLAGLAVPAGAVLCAPDVTPAATLLVPFFMVELSTCPSGGMTTVLVITNALPEAVVAQVTAWTDWSVPEIDFPIYLTGFDVQTFDMRDIFCSGNIPVTGLGISNQGPLSGDPGAFASCGDASTPGVPPHYINPAVTVAFREHLKAIFTGQPSPFTGNCGGSPSGSMARGYVTIDVTTDCNLLFPSDPTYHTSGTLSGTNALLGEYTYHDPSANLVSTFPAVHLEASDDLVGGPTFYGRYAPAGFSDAREPLPEAFAARFFGGGGLISGTRLFVWREGDSSDSEISCATTPTWYPLADAAVTFFDEEENAVVTPVGFFGEANVFEAVGGFHPFPLGWTTLDFGNPAGGSQSWVTVLYDAPGFAAGRQATPLAGNCSPSP